MSRSLRPVRGVVDHTLGVTSAVATTMVIVWTGYFTGPVGVAVLGGAIFLYNVPKLFKACFSPD